MKSKFQLLSIAVLTACSVIGAAEPPHDPKTEKPTGKEQGRLSKAPPAAIAHLPGPLSLEAIREQVKGLKKDDVAWRKIQWKTCLLDGLQASRQQNKPIMLWIFIDLPIDDERC